VLSEAAEDELIGTNPLLYTGRRRRRSKARQAEPTHDHPLTREELAEVLNRALTHFIERKGETVFSLP
jgi:hypothetical protein